MAKKSRDDGDETPAVESKKKKWLNINVKILNLNFYCLNYVGQLNLIDELTHEFKVQVVLPYQIV